MDILLKEWWEWWRSGLGWVDLDMVLFGVYASQWGMSLSCSLSLFGLSQVLYTLTRINTQHRLSCRYSVAWTQGIVPKSKGVLTLVTTIGESRNENCSGITSWVQKVARLCNYMRTPSRESRHSRHRRG